MRNRDREGTAGDLVTSRFEAGSGCALAQPSAWARARKHSELSTLYTITYTHCAAPRLLVFTSYLFAVDRYDRKPHLTTLVIVNVCSANWIAARFYM